MDWDLLDSMIQELRHEALMADEDIVAKRYRYAKRVLEALRDGDFLPKLEETI